MLTNEYMTQGVSGRQSFSLLYTSINVLSGHYTR